MCVPYFLYDWVPYKNQNTKDKNYQKMCLHIIIVFKLTPTIEFFFINLWLNLAIQLSCKVILCGKLDACIKGYCLWCVTLVVNSGILQYF